jgi:hypothetical protein
MEITLPDGRDMVLAQGQPGTLREFDGFACDARLAAVRYDRSGEPMGVLMVEGSTLRIDGDQVLNVQRPDTSCVVLGREQTVPSDDVIVNMDGLSVIDVQ